MSKALTQRGHKVLLAAHARSELWQKAQGEGVEIHQTRVGRTSFLNPFHILKIARFLRQHRVRTIILNLPSDLKAAGIAARLAGVEKIIYRRGSAIPIRNTFFNRFLFRYIVTDAIANSEETKRTILANNPDLFPREKIEVIYNGIDLQEYDRRQSVPVYHGDGREIVLGTAGRLSSEKNQKFLIDVARELKGRGLPFKLLIAGKGELKDELRAYAAEKGVADRVVFSGFVEDIKSFMISIDIFLLSSRWEGFGYVLVEAMAARKPVVAFDSSSTPEIISNTISGYLAEPGDVGGFALQVAELAGDQEVRNQFGKAGRTRVEEVFDIRRALEKIEKMVLRRD